MIVIQLADGSYACPIGFKNNFLNAFRFKSRKEAIKFAKGKYSNYTIKEF